jgi:hexosaminidase
MAVDLNRIILLPAPRRITLQPQRSSRPLELRIDSTITRAGGYTLTISPQATRLVAHDDAAAFHGRQTFAQLQRQFGQTLPCLEIQDWPDFPIRGVMLDISRDKAPTLSTLFSLVDRLAHWKINQLQLYMEHTFAYQGHEQVWQNASPLMREDILRLDAYCRSRFIELVPNQNSFGHMERWLRHPRYLPLAEAPDGADTPWGFRWKGPFSLCPTDPRAMEFLADLYGQLLPHFSSRLFNVGCDETFDIGQGRSKAACESRGRGRVYLEFLNRIHDLVAGHGRRMMFWGDVILSEPALIGQIPKDTIALNWGYEANHPFDREAARFREAGIEFYVCPGTSSWCSIAGRTDNMLANIRSAADAGLKHGAAGFLNTDWGDHGHLQYLPISYPGLAAGAAMCWCADSNRDQPLAPALDLHAFCDRAAVMGTLACDLGNVYQSVGKSIGNRSALFNILVPSSTHSDPMNGIARPGLEAAAAAIVAAMRRLDSAQMDSPDAELIKSEFANAAAMLRHACRRGKWRLDPSSVKRSELSEELSAIIESHRRCWLARNRLGGMEDSVARLAERTESE